jgi:hypothetical protein
MSQGPGNAKFLAARQPSAPARQNAGYGRLALFALLAAAVVGSAWFTAHRSAVDSDDPVIAVLVSRSNSTTWPRLVQSFTSAAKRNGWGVSESTVSDPDDRLRITFSDGGAVVFRLYKELGHGGLRDRVLSLCDSPRPPIALLSGANSGSGRVVAQALHDREASGRSAPVYLLTSGTVDDLTTIHAKKTFRFGHKNSRQAQEVVGRLTKLYEERGVDPPTVRVALMEVEDDPFACEFSRLVKQELAKTFGESRLQFDSRKLPTATGPYDDPAPQERTNAKWLAREMSYSPGEQWVVVLPSAADVNRRVWLSLHEALQEMGANEIARNYDSLAFIAGDSLDFVDFVGPLKPGDLHATAIFYAQYDPRLPGEKTADPVLIREALYHEIAETALGALAEPSARTSAESLRAALAGYRRMPNEPPFFEGPERRAGGGPVVVRSNPVESRFTFAFSTETR